MKRIKITLAFLCYVLGVVISLYVGGWVMLVDPVLDVVAAWQQKELGAVLIMICTAKVLLSTTVGGFIWSAGYILSNHFSDSVNEEEEKEKEKEQPPVE